MKIRNLDANGDFTFGKGLQNYLTGQAAIALDVRTFVKLWAGNAFWALQEGINWRQYLDRNQQANAQAALQAGILGRNGVVGVNQISVQLDRQARRFTIKYDVATIYTQSFVDTVTIGTPNA